MLFHMRICSMTLHTLFINYYELSQRHSNSCLNETHLNIPVFSVKHTSLFILGTTIVQLRTQFRTCLSGH